MAKDMGKNQQINQNVKAENPQAQNPNFQSSVSSSQSTGGDSMLTNENFRPVDGGEAPGFGPNPYADGGDNMLVNENGRPTFGDDGFGGNGGHSSGGHGGLDPYIDQGGGNAQPGGLVGVNNKDGCHMGLPFVSR